MPRPHRKIPRPPPGDITVRRADGQEVTVDPDDFMRLKQQEMWRREAGQDPRRVTDDWDPHGFRLLDKQRILALREGDVITIFGDELPDLLWFVRDVNGMTEEVTACTAILGKPQERTVPFDEVLIENFDDDPERQHEAAAEYTSLKARLGRARHGRDAA